MPQFTLIPRSPPRKPIVTNSNKLLDTLSQLNSPEADVLQGNEYAFTIKRCDKGVWIIRTER